jgi:geranylgeranyl pyrophosphate synthase
MGLKISDELAMPERITGPTKSVVSKLNLFGAGEFVNKALFRPSMHLLKRPGKLLRPALVFLGADYIGVEELGRYVDLAAAVELLHISSMIHDDIVDKDSKRRGIMATHAKYGLEGAILSGDALIAKAMLEANKYGRDVVDSISRAALEMCAGEITDYNYQKNMTVPKMEEYLKVAELKSSSLMGVSTSAAALHVSDRKARKLYEFGVALGTAFQLRDDMMDFLSLNEAKDGRKIKDYRLNAVRCIKEHRGCDIRSALREAERLNNSYIRNAVSKLGSGNNASLLAEYAARVAVRLK